MSSDSRFQLAHACYCQLSLSPVDCSREQVENVTSPIQLMQGNLTAPCNWRACGAALRALVGFIDLVLLVAGRACLTGGGMQDTSRHC